MPFEKTIRPLNPNEQKLLRKRKAGMVKKLKSKFKLYHYIIAALLGAICAYLAAIIKNDFLIFIFGTVGVFAFGFVVFIPFEMYKANKEKKKEITNIARVLEYNKIEVSSVHASRIAMALEYEDEGILFIIEYEPDGVLYLSCYPEACGINFPCLHFEIYTDELSKVMGTEILTLSEQIQPIEIDPKAKWAYFKKNGVPGHLEMEKVSFDAVVNRFNGVG